MNKLESILNTYRGRDRAIRTTSYACFFLSGLTRGRSKERLCIVGTQLNSCRTVLRLFDDISMLNYNLQYGFGKQEEDKITRWLSVIRNFADQLFYPIEHIAWASDQQIVHLDSSSWWYSSTFLWLLSLYLNLLKVIRSLFILQRKKKVVALIETSDLSSDMLAKKLHQNIQLELLSIIEYGTDLINAIHWMPKSFLWGGKLQLWQVGLFGLISSIIGGYKMHKLSKM